MMRRLNKRTAGAPAGTDPVQGSGAAGSKSAVVMAFIRS